jgi:hypothetical protein
MPTTKIVTWHPGCRRWPHAASHTRHMAFSNIAALRAMLAKLRAACWPHALYVRAPAPAGAVRYVQA